ncbi:MAG: glycosyltransferase [Opitutales bacterium]
MSLPETHETPAHSLDRAAPSAARLNANGQATAQSAPSVAFIITAYNKWDYLQRSLRAVSKLKPLPNELIIADDGSADETRHSIDRFLEGFDGSVQTLHVWQEDKGYRRSRALNKAIAQCTSDIVVFSDSDCLPHKRFIGDHRRLLKASHYISGGRAYIHENSLERFDISLPGRLWGVWRGYVFPKKASFRIPFIENWETNASPCGANLSLWREDLIALNGFDECFEGWGFEDTDLMMRAENLGIQRQRICQRCLIYHQEHPLLSRAQLDDNERTYEARKAAGQVRADLGVDQYL